MKTLKFRPALARMIMAGQKTTTWRLFDDKDLKAGDTVKLINWETLEEFAEAEVENVKEATLGTLEEEDKDGHERFVDQEDMLTRLREYYGEKVTLDTAVKVIKFKLINSSR